MIKKIDSSKTNIPSTTDPVSRSTPAGPARVGTVGVGTVGQVSPATEQQRTARVRRPTRPMTSAEREHLFKLIHEEADKMFGPNGLPESQRRTLEGAVKITVDASMVEEENAEEKKLK